MTLVRHLVCSIIFSSQKSGGKSRGRRGHGSSSASKRFCRRLQEDQARFSLEKGNDPFIARGRARLQAVPGALELVQAMASFAPRARPTMLEVLNHEAFASLRVGLSGDTAIGRGTHEDAHNTLELMAFARRDGDTPLLNL